MLSRILSGAVYGVDAIQVQVEADLAGGLPAFTVVGLPDAAVRESRERVAAALKNSEFAFPARRITINLAPAGLRKEGALYDLPIALGLLVSSEQIDSFCMEKTLAVGELSLDGKLRPVRGVLPMALCARELGLEVIIVPSENAEEAAAVEGVAVWPARSLTEVVERLRFPKGTPPYKRSGKKEELRTTGVDLLEVCGQEQARRAVEIAAAGGHNILFIGPPGSGKTMIARRIPSILPELSRDESLDVTRIYSVSGLLKPGTSLIRTRPFRSPHHSASDAGLIGGGSYPRPGEISLSHNGVLFLDELPEFRKSVLELLRQPLEEGSITISRSSGTVRFPAAFMLAAAMNPCPCGYHGEPRCTCDPAQVQRYVGKLSGPLLDRIDMHIEVPRISYGEISGREKREGSAAVRKRVIAARKVQHGRLASLFGTHTNSRMGTKEIRRYCALDEDGKGLLRTAMERLSLSARAYTRILRLARTIADLAGEKEIRSPHVAEAIQYRSLDRRQ